MPASRHRRYSGGWQGQSTSGPRRRDGGSRPGVRGSSSLPESTRTAVGACPVLPGSAEVPRRPLVPLDGHRCLPDDQVPPHEQAGDAGAGKGLAEAAAQLAERVPRRPHLGRGVFPFSPHTVGCTQACPRDQSPGPLAPLGAGESHDGQRPARANQLAQAAQSCPGIRQRCSVALDTTASNDARPRGWVSTSPWHHVTLAAGNRACVPQAAGERVSSAGPARGTGPGVALG